LLSPTVKNYFKIATFLTLTVSESF